LCDSKMLEAISRVEAEVRADRRHVA
jgi:hypothetical protein